MELREKISKLFVEKDKELLNETIKEAFQDIAAIAPALIGGGVGATALGKVLQEQGDNKLERDKNRLAGAVAGGLGGATLAQLASALNPGVTEGVS